jgi:hypothetical protein
VSRASLALPFSTAGEGSMNFQLFVDFVAGISDLQGRDSETATVAFSEVSNTMADKILTGVMLSELDGPKQEALGNPGKQDVTLVLLYIFVLH